MQLKKKMLLGVVLCIPSLSSGALADAYRGNYYLDARYYVDCNSTTDECEDKCSMIRGNLTKPAMEVFLDALTCDVDIVGSIPVNVTGAASWSGELEWITAFTLELRTLSSFVNGPVPSDIVALGLTSYVAYAADVSNMDFTAQPSETLTAVLKVFDGHLGVGAKCSYLGDYNQTAVRLNATETYGNVEKWEPGYRVDLDLDYTGESSSTYSLGILAMNFVVEDAEFLQNVFDGRLTLQDTDLQNSVLCFELALEDSNTTAHDFIDALHTTWYLDGVLELHTAMYEVKYATAADAEVAADPENAADADDAGETPAEIVLKSFDNVTTCSACFAAGGVWCQRTESIARRDDQLDPVVKSSVTYPTAAFCVKHELYCAGLAATCSGAPYTMTDKLPTLQLYRLNMASAVQTILPA